MHRLPEINENLDRQSLFFSMLLTMYHKRVLSLSTYDELSQEIKTLKELRNIMFSLLITTNTWVPYLDEVIVDNDHYIIDRNTQVSKEKALKNFAFGYNIAIRCDIIYLSFSLTAQYDTRLPGGSHGSEVIGKE